MYLEVALAFTSVYIIYSIICYISQNRRGLPPGPFPLPVIGNMLAVDPSKPHISFRDMSIKYGNIFRLQLGIQKVVVVNSGAIAREALLKRSTAFAGRPPSVAGSLFSCGYKDIAFQTYSSIWKVQHRIAKSGIRKCENKINSIEECIYREIKELMTRMDGQEAKSIDLRPDLFSAIVNCLSALVFGSRYESHDVELQTLKNIIESFRVNLGAASFLDAFPLLSYLPCKTLREVKTGVQIKEQFFNQKYSEHINTFKPGRIRDLVDAMIAASLEDENKDTNGNSISDTRIILSITDTFIAGSETPTAGLLWIFSTLAQFPEVQRKLQENLDEVVGRDRLPMMHDKPKLPYVEAVIAEVMRFVSFMPLAVPHCTIADVSLGGYVIPKDTVVYFNTWAIHHNPMDFTHPMKFQPERFLDSEGKFCGTRRTDSSYMPFSLGKRSCLGESIARTEMFLFTAQLVHQFHFEPSPDTPLPDPLTTPFGLVMSPGKFNLTITKRN